MGKGRIVADKELSKEEYEEYEEYECYLNREELHNLICKRHSYKKSTQALSLIALIVGLIGCFMLIYYAITPPYPVVFEDIAGNEVEVMSDGSANLNGYELTCMSDVAPNSELYSVLVLMGIAFVFGVWATFTDNERSELIEKEVEEYISDLKNDTE